MPQCIVQAVQEHNKLLQLSVLCLREKCGHLSLIQNPFVCKDTVPQRTVSGLVDPPLVGNVPAEFSEIPISWYVDMLKIIDQPITGVAVLPAFPLCKGLFREDTEIGLSGSQEAVDVVCGVILVLVKNSPQSNQ